MEPVVAGDGVHRLGHGPQAKGIIGAEHFIGQHDVHAVGDDVVMMFDNRGDMTGSRVLEIELGSMPMPHATITKSWMLVNGSGDPLLCGVEGTAEYVAGTTADHVIAMCNDRFSVVEMDDPTGNTGTPPPLVITLPDTGAATFCTSGGPPSRVDIHGWHKAYSSESIGGF